MPCEKSAKIQYYRCLKDGAVHIGGGLINKIDHFRNSNHKDGVFTVRYLNETGPKKVLFYISKKDSLDPNRGIRHDKWVREIDHQCHLNQNTEKHQPNHLSLCPRAHSG